MDHVDVFYLVREAEYNQKLSQQPQLNKMLEELPNNQEKRVRKLLEYLQSNGLSWNCYGLTTTQIPEIPSSFYILEYVKNAVSIDKIEPLYFNDFLRNHKRLSVPVKFLCKKVQRKISLVDDHEQSKADPESEDPKVEEDTFSFI